MFSCQLFLSSALSLLVYRSALRSQGPIPSTPQDGHNRRSESWLARPMVMLYALVPKIWTVSHVLMASPTCRHLSLASQDYSPLVTLTPNIRGQCSQALVPLLTPPSLVGFLGLGFRHSCLQLSRASPGLLSTATELEAYLSSPLNPPSSPVHHRTSFLTPMHISLHPDSSLSHTPTPKPSPATVIVPQTHADPEDSALTLLHSAPALLELGTSHGQQFKAHSRPRTRCRCPYQQPIVKPPGPALLSEPPSNHCGLWPPLGGLASDCRHLTPGAKVLPQMATPLSPQPANIMPEHTNHLPSQHLYCT